MSSLAVLLPMSTDSMDGFAMIKDYKSLVKQNLKMLMLTVPGERIMLPKYGVGLKNTYFLIFMKVLKSRYEMILDYKWLNICRL